MGELGPFENGPHTLCQTFTRIYLRAAVPTADFGALHFVSSRLKPTPFPMKPDLLMSLKGQQKEEDVRNIDVWTPPLLTAEEYKSEVVAEINRILTTRTTVPLR